jgi:HAD superfamily hydrolase (TIGR01549 family)
MSYKSLFIDLDHTLCDTEGADKKAVIDFDKTLLNEWNIELENNIASQFIQAIYNPPLSVDFAELRINDPALHRSSLLYHILLENNITHISKEDCTNLNSLFMDLRMKYFDFFDGVSELLMLLRKKYKLVLITNGPSYSQRSKITKCEVESFFDHILVGGEQAYSKPHASIFNSACELAGCNISEAIHIGDSLESDIAGANQIGLDCIWVSAAIESIPSNYQAKWIVNSFIEIAPILNKD